MEVMRDQRAVKGDESMTGPNDELLQLLKEIRDLLVPISGCFEDQYRETKVKQFRELLTPTRRRVFPLLFHPRRLSQDKIAEAAQTSQPTISRFVSALLESGLIQEASDREGNPVYEDVFDLGSVAEEHDEQE
jgi:DNA-binding transcriptional ArsR family regulator